MQQAQIVAFHIVYANGRSSSVCPTVGRVGSGESATGGQNVRLSFSCKSCVLIYASRDVNVS